MYNRSMDSLVEPKKPGLAADHDEIDTLLLSAASTVIAVDSIRYLREDSPMPAPFRRGPRLEIRGKLLLPSAEAFAKLSERFRSLGHIAILRKVGDDDVVLAVPYDASATASKPWLAIALFVATVLSVLWVGSTGEEATGSLFDIFRGWPFAASMLSILLAHEFGHYLVSRYFGTPVTLPYFIPLPISLFGTMGAIIRMKGPPRDRRALLAIAVAGPLAGLAMAIPILVIGLRLSVVESTAYLPPGTILQEGNSLLYAALKFVLFGRFLPSGNEDVMLHPVAMAGWVGLLVTGLNLIPAAQLDGGHIVYALLGERARWLTWSVVVILLLLGLVWQGWLLWAALVLVFGRAQVMLLDSITTLRRGERGLALLMLVIFVLVFVPVPMVLR